MSENARYEIPAIDDEDERFAKEMAITLSPNALRLKNEYHKKVEELNCNDEFRAKLKTLKLGHARLDILRPEYAAECIAMCAYQSSMFGESFEALLLHYPILDTLRFMHILVHLTVAFGTGVVVLDHKCSVVAVVLGFDLMHWKTTLLKVLQSILVVNDNNNGNNTNNTNNTNNNNNDENHRNIWLQYDHYLESLCILNHPLLRQFFIWPSSDLKSNVIGINEKEKKNIDWKQLFYIKCAYVKPGFERSSIPQLLVPIMFGVPYALGYRYTCHIPKGVLRTFFHSSSSLLSQMWPELVSNSSHMIKLKEVVFPNRIKLIDVVKKKALEYNKENDSVKKNLTFNVLLPNAQIQILVVDYSQLSKDLSISDVSRRYLITKKPKNSINPKL